MSGTSETFFVSGNVSTMDFDDLPVQEFPLDFSKQRSSEAMDTERDENYNYLAKLAKTTAISPLTGTKSKCLHAFTCALCNKSFSTKANRDKHHRNLHLLERKKCGICEKVLSNVYNLKRHVDGAHGAILDQKTGVVYERLADGSPGAQIPLRTGATSMRTTTKATATVVSEEPTKKGEKRKATSDTAIVAGKRRETGQELVSTGELMEEEIKDIGHEQSSLHDSMSPNQSMDSMSGSPKEYRNDSPIQQSFFEAFIPARYRGIRGSFEGAVPDNDLQLYFSEEEKGVMADGDEKYGGTKEFSRKTSETVSEIDKLENGNAGKIETDRHDCEGAANLQFSTVTESEKVENNSQRQMEGNIAKNEFLSLFGLAPRKTETNPSELALPPATILTEAERRAASRKRFEQKMEKMVAFFALEERKKSPEGLKEQGRIQRKGKAAREKMMKLLNGGSELRKSERVAKKLAKEAAVSGVESAETAPESAAVQEVSQSAKQKRGGHGRRSPGSGRIDEGKPEVASGREIIVTRQRSRTQ